MSGIVGGMNLRSSGLVNNSSASDGQIFTGTGAGLPAGFEAAAGGGGKILQVGARFINSGTFVSTSGTYVQVDFSGTDFACEIVPTLGTSNLLVFFEFKMYKANNVSGNGLYAQMHRKVHTGTYTNVAGLFTYLDYYSVKQVSQNWASCCNMLVGGHASEWNGGAWSEGQSVYYSLFAHAGNTTPSFQIGQGVARAIIIEIDDA